MSTPLARTVLVTGSNRGLGLEMVRQLVTADTPPEVIIATCRAPEKAKELQDLAQDHKQIKVIKLDVVDYESYPHLVKTVKEAVGQQGLNLLVNNAGRIDTCSSQSFGVSLEHLEPHMFRGILETNTIAPFMLIKALLPLVKTASGTGPSGGLSVSRAAIVNISSILGSIGDYTEKPDCFAYRASKAAINMVTRSLVEALEGVSVLCVSMHPGWVQTDMGGPTAPLTKEESVSRMIKTLSTLTTKHNGLLISYDGNILQF